MPDKCTNPLLRPKNRRMYKINQHNSTSDIIKITMTPTTNFVAGISVTFSSGTVTIDWKDGSAPENFVSGTEKLHTYVTAGTYIAEISGSLTNITKFIADTCRITFIENLKTGLLTDFRINNNLYSGILNMSLAPVSGTFYCLSNANLTGITFASAGNAKVTIFWASDCNITGNLDLSKVPIGGYFYIWNSVYLTGITFAGAGNSIMNEIKIHGCGLTGNLDLTNVPISNVFWVRSNANLIGITFKSTGNARLLSVTLYSNNLDYINLAGLGIDLNINSYNLDIKNNAMSVSDVNHILVDLDAISSAGYTGRVINIGGTNADPDSSSGGYDGLAAKASLESKGFTVTIT